MLQQKGRKRIDGSGDEPVPGEPVHNAGERAAEEEGAAAGQGEQGAPRQAQAQKQPLHRRRRRRLLAVVPAAARRRRLGGRQRRQGRRGGAVVVLWREEDQVMQLASSSMHGDDDVDLL